MLSRSRVLMALLVCTGCASEVPPQLESGFAMANDSLAFPNFSSGYDASAMDAALVQRMFGDDVCQNAASPCQLTPAARAFVNRANRAMGGGRCEGFAVMSSLFAEGRLSPETFGALTARELALDGNAALQREIAYWFATQLVPEATTVPTKQYMPRDVMPALVKALKPDAKERWRLGIVRKKGKVISGGHALTPIGYYADPKLKGVYWLRVYDNNTPDAERLLKIDTVNNRWEYEASENPKRMSRLYFGDDSNKNPLYLSPVFTREGVLPCFFCGSEGATQVSTEGGAQVSLETPDGTTGVSEGELSGGAAPAFSFGLDEGPAAFLFTVPASQAVNLKVTAPPDADNPGAEQALQVAGVGFTVSAEDLSVTGTDRLSVGAGGTSVAYANESRTSLSLKTEVTLPGGRALAVRAVVNGGSSEVTASVDPQTGQVNVGAGDSAGSQVTMVVSTTDEMGRETNGQLTFMSQGDGGITADTTGFMEGDALTGTVTNNGMTMTVTNACQDGVKSGMESDIDCGAVCVERCAVGKGCGTGADCQSTFCNLGSGVCVATSCQDGARSGDESDVDCGGSCSPCAVGKACARNADCAGTAACSAGACVPTFAVGVAVTGLPIASSLVLQNNGADDLTVGGNGSFLFPTRVTGPYNVTVLVQSSVAVCTVTQGAGTATADVLVQVQCTPTFAVAGTVTGLPAGDQLTLRNNGESLVLSANGAFTFPTRVTSAYAVTVQTQPAGAACVVTRGSGVATSDVTDVTVSCSSGFSIGGVLSGLPIGQSVTLRNNGGDDLTLLANGTFSFATPATGYAVSVHVQPMGAVCSVSGGSGTATATVTSVAVLCVASGELDLSFNTVGWLASPQGVGSDLWIDGLLNTDGSMTLVGQITGGSGDTDWVVSKVTASGALDPNFGSGGHSTLSRGAAIEYPRGVYADVMGNVVVVGSLYGTSDIDVGFARFTPNGTLDPTFGIAGVAVADFGGWEYIEDVARDALGRFVVVGRTSLNGAGPHDVVVARFLDNGTLDNGFGTNGRVTWDNGGDEGGTSVAIDAATQDILVTASTAGAGDDTAVLRYSSIGTLVSGFGAGGVVLLDLAGGGRSELPYRITTSGSKALVVGRANNASNSDLVVAQLTSTGALDATFGVGGKVLFDNGGNEVGYAITPRPSGGWYVGGHRDSFMLVTALSAAGVVDTSFGTAGFFEETLANSALAYHLMVDSAGRIVAVGTIRLTGTEDLGVARILP
jgi:uncharacterized delta-60 repeat protein